MTHSDKTLIRDVVSDTFIIKPDEVRVSTLQRIYLKKIETIFYKHCYTTYNMEFTVTHVYETLYAYKLFMEEQQVTSLDTFKRIIDRTNLNSEYLSRTKTEVLVCLNQLNDKNIELCDDLSRTKTSVLVFLNQLNDNHIDLRDKMHDMKKNMDDMKKDMMDDMKKDMMDDMKKEIDDMKKDMMDDMKKEIDDMKKEMMHDMKTEMMHDMKKEMMHDMKKELVRCMT
jgi:hypothetical protein